MKLKKLLDTQCKKVRKHLVSKNLAKLGVKDKTDWVLTCYHELVSELKKVAPDSDRKATMRINNACTIIMRKKSLKVK